MAGSEAYLLGSGNAVVDRSRRSPAKISTATYSAVRRNSRAMCPFEALLAAYFPPR